MPRGEHMTTHEAELGVIPVDIVLRYFRRQSAHHEEPAVTMGDAARPMDDLGRRMPWQRTQRGGIMDMDSVVGLAREPVELAEIDRDRDLGDDGDRTLRTTSGPIFAKHPDRRAKTGRRADLSMKPSVARHSRPRKCLAIIGCPRTPTF